MLKWFEYTQNNSGGTFVTNDKLCHRIFIEARNAEEANGFAESLGIYFDGCSTGDDCPCCGDRWNTPWDEVKFPFVYGRFSEEEAKRIADTYQVTFRPAKRDRPSVLKYEAKRTHEVIFPSIEPYARFLTDQYGWTSPDCRLFYHDGTVLEIRSAKLEEELQQRKRKRNENL